MSIGEQTNLNKTRILFSVFRELFGRWGARGPAAQIVPIRRPDRQRHRTRSQPRPRRAPREEDGRARKRPGGLRPPAPPERAAEGRKRGRRAAPPKRRGRGGTERERATEAPQTDDRAEAPCGRRWGGTAGRRGAARRADPGAPEGSNGEPTRPGEARRGRP